MDGATQKKSTASRERKSSRKVSESRRFERFIEDLSTKFASLPYERIDSEINDALRKTTELLKTDRTGIFELRPGAFEVVHGYARPGVASPIGVRLDQLNWFFSKIQHGEPVVFMHIPDDLPEEAKQEREYCESIGLKAIATIPIQIAGSHWGSISTASFQGVQSFPSRLPERLKLVGEIVANAFVRKRMEEQRRQAELEAQRNREELTRIARVSAAGELVASIAHELNQPLTGILSNAQAALKFLSRPEPADLHEIQQIMNEVIEDDKRAVEVIRKLRSLIKKGTPEFTVLNLNTLVNDLCVLFKSEAVIRDVNLSQELAEDLPQAHADLVQIQQVLLNLLLNALDSVQSFPLERRKIIVRTANPEYGMLNLSVQDFGKGIDPELTNKLFEPFFTTKQEGMGMGLSISRSIIKAHGGKIWFENNSDFGSTFYFSIPVSPNTKTHS